MKINIIVAIGVGLILISFTGCQSSQKPIIHSKMCPYCDNMENVLADKIILALKEKNTKSFKVLLPTPALVHEYCSSMNLSPDKKQKFLNYYLKEIGDNKKEIIESFTTVLNEGEKKGILWDKIKLKSTEGFVKFDIKTHCTQLTRFSLIVSCLGKEYKIYVNNCEFILGDCYIMQPIIME